jgi:hypothetical protein
VAYLKWTATVDDGSIRLDVCGCELSGLNRDKSNVAYSDDCWTTVAAAASIDFSGNKAIAILSVISGYGKTVSVLGVLNDDSYLAPLCHSRLARTSEHDHHGSLRPLVQRRRDSRRDFYEPRAGREPQ